MTLGVPVVLLTGVTLYTIFSLMFSLGRVKRVDTSSVQLTDTNHYPDLYLCIECDTLAPCRGNAGLPARAFYFFGCPIKS